MANTPIDSTKKIVYGLTNNNEFFQASLEAGVPEEDKALVNAILALVVELRWLREVIDWKPKE